MFESLTGSIGSPYQLPENMFVYTKVHNISSDDLVLRWHCYCAEELCCRETNMQSVILEKYHYLYTDLT